MPRRLAELAVCAPDRPFLTEVGGPTLTYGQTWELVRRWAGWLADLGIERGDRVVSALRSSIDAHALWLACGCVGAWEVAVNPDLRGELLENVLQDAGARYCFTRAEDAERFTAAGRGITTIVVDRERPRAAGYEPAPIGAFPAPEDVACVIFTSGSSGMPKGVMITWGQMSASVGRIPRSWLSEADVAYSFHSMAHVTGRTPLPSMCDVTGRVVLRERFSASAFWDDVRSHGCTTTTVVAPLLLAQPERPDDADNPLRVVFGGHPLGQARRFAERFDVAVLANYGSTEAGFPMSNRWPLESPSPRAGWLRRGYQAKIVDESGLEVPEGTAGELWVKPPARALMARGYLNSEERTRRAFVGDWYRTGDVLVRHPDGGFEFVDRMGDTVRRLGENISLTALEHVVGQAGSVAECVACGVEDDLVGTALLVVVVPSGGRELDPAALYAQLADRLPKYMHPTYIAQVSELPRAANSHKPRRSELKVAELISGAWQAPQPARGS
ncbi:MAG TPA: AMP-binding protein [Amycolatopsis sp.]|nr:AMP-binding protein [Amycolatopsis sp.]